MGLTCIVIDKNSSTLKLLTGYIGQNPAINLSESFDNLPSAIHYLQLNHVDLVFIELSIDANAVIDLVKSIHDKTMVIITVASEQLPKEILELHVVDFLIKPFQFDRFSIAATKAIDQHKMEIQTGEIIYIRSSYQLVKVNLNDVEFIESVENYIKIHLANGQSLMSLMPLKVIMDKLPQNKFIRIHRRFIVPVHKIKLIANRKIKMDSIELPVGFRYLMNLRSLINK